MSIDERHHRSRTQATSPAIKPPRLDRQRRSSAAPPELRQESCEEYPYPPCQDIFCHGSQGQGQVNPSPRTRWVGDRSSEPRSREWRWSKTRVFARGFWPVVRGTFEQFKTRLLRVVGRERPEGEGSVRRAVHRAVRGACFALAPQYGPSKRGVPTSLGHPTTRKGQGIC